MAFCPNCEAEYKPGIAVCSDCNFELVPELNARTRVHDKEPGGPVPFQVFKTSTEADMVSELLEHNNIRSFVKGGTFSLLPSSFSQDIVLMVDERDLDRAFKIYEEYFDPDSHSEKEHNS
jgi:hypothetical protein